MKNIYTSLLLCLLAVSGFAQATGTGQHYCLTDEIWARMAQRDPSLAAKREQMDMAISNISNKGNNLRNSGQRSGTSTGTTVIPIVIYIVYDTVTANISMAQIQSQVDQLNQNFALYGYSFCYAKRNVSDTSYFVPQAGDSAGVFRINSALSSVDAYSTDAQLKALSTLPTENYLKIFVVHSITPQGILGYALLPGTSTQLDGVVIRSDVFGSNNLCSGCQLLPTYNLGATLTHEVGHFLDLYHTFQGGCDTGTTYMSCAFKGDWVCDTPPTDGSFGCPNPAPLSCNGVDRELISNYMDYTDDPCKNEFTAGQKTRMDFAIRVYRQVLTSDQNLINTGVICADLSTLYANFYSANFNGCKNKPMTFASLSSPGFTYTWSFGDGSTGTGDTVQHTYTSLGKYTVSLTASSTSQNISAVNTIPVFITDCSPIACSVNKWDFEYGYMDFSSGTPIATNHTSFETVTTFADFYLSLYRADSMGNTLFHISPRSTGIPSQPGDGLIDSSFNIVDSFGIGGIYYTIIPVPKHYGTFCLVGDCYHTATDYNNAIDTCDYSIIETQNGNIRVRPGKKLVNVPFPAGFQRASFYHVLGIPDCDETRFWVIINPYETGIFYVFQLDTTATLTFHQKFTLPNAAVANPFSATVSPNGRMIAFGLGNYSGTSGVGYLDFDKGTGNIGSYNILFSTPVPYGPSNAAPSPVFSPNSRFIYYTDACCQMQFGATSYLCQSDMYSAAPYATRKIIAQIATTPPYFTPNQKPHMGPDRKIYIGKSDNPGNNPETYRLAVINNPNTLENGLNSVNYNENGPDIRPANCPYVWQLNLDGFSIVADNNDAYGCDWSPSVPYPFSFSATGCLSYTFHSDECFTTQWNFGDPASGATNTSTLGSPSHVFSHTGDYVVTLLSGGHTFTDTVHIAGPQVQISGTPVNPCPAPYANYSVAAQPGVSYNWTVTNGTPTTAHNRSDLSINWNPSDSIGSIMVIALDTNLGCTDTATLSVNYSITNTGLVSWIGGTVTLSTSSSPLPLTGGTPPGGIYSGPGVTGNTFYPASVAPGSHTITYSYTDNNGCTGSVSRVFVVTGLGNLYLENHISLYPNPASGILIAQSDLFASSVVQVAVYDMTGRQISVPVVRGADKATFDISGLADGVYSVKFTVNGSEASKRFVKME